jgi:hypothetical protein
MADTLALGANGRKAVEVQVLSRAPKYDDNTMTDEKPKSDWTLVRADPPPDGALCVFLCCTSETEGKRVVYRVGCKREGEYRFDTENVEVLAWIVLPETPNNLSVH